MSDLERFKELVKRIEFLRNTTSEAELIHAIEQELCTFCEFQCTFHKYAKCYWDYYIRCDLKYPPKDIPKSDNKLESLYKVLLFLVREGIH